MLISVDESLPAFVRKDNGTETRRYPGWPDSRASSRLWIAQKSNLWSCRQSILHGVNSVIFVMSEDLFQYRLDDIYNTRQNCSNSFLAMIYLVLALGERSEAYFKAASSLFDKSIEEGSEESVQVVMLTVWVWWSRYFNKSLIVLGPLQAKPKPEESCLDSLRDRNSNCSVSGTAFNRQAPGRTLSVPGSMQKKAVVFALWTGTTSRMREG